MLERKLIRLETPIRGRRLIELTKHAVIRMEGRGVAEEDLLRTLEIGRGVPGKQPPGVKRVRWQRSDGDAIHVVFQVEKDRLLVISVITKLDE